MISSWTIRKKLTELRCSVRWNFGIQNLETNRKQTQRLNACERTFRHKKAQEKDGELTLHCDDHSTIHSNPPCGSRLRRSAATILRAIQLCNGLAHLRRQTIHRTCEIGAGKPFITPIFDRERLSPHFELRFANSKKKITSRTLTR